MTIHGTSRALVALAVLAPVAAMLVAVGPASGVTTAAKDGAPQISLCHRTNSATNPYVHITVDANAVIRQGHDDHVGPVWNSTLKAAGIRWGDIIPAFDYTTNKGVSRHYTGMNTGSLSIIAAGCVIAPTSVSVPAPVGADETCTTSGTITVTAVTGVAWKIDGNPVPNGVNDVAAGAHTVAAVALPGYVLTGQSTFAISIAAKANCDLIVSPQAPIVVASSICGVEGTYTIPATTHVSYLLTGTPISAGTYNGPKAGTVTALAESGYTLSNPAWSYSLSLAAAEACAGYAVVTPKAPTVEASTMCEVEGTYTIPATDGVIYLVNSKVVAAGTHKGPATGTVTAKAEEGYTLSTTTWSYALKLPAAAACPIDDEATQAPTDEAVTAPTEKTTLAKTGASTTTLATIGALAALMGSVLLAYGSRRPEESEI